MNKLDLFLKERFNQYRPTTAITLLKQNKDGLLDELVSHTLFLDEEYNNISVNQRVHHYINKIYQVRKCDYCGSKLQIKPYNARIVGEYYNKTCDNLDCRKKVNSDNSRKGCLEKHGVVNISQTPQWKENVSNTNLKRHGVKWFTQHSKLQNECKKAIFKNLTEINSARQKAYIKTSFDRYGVKHPRQDAEIFSKSHGNWFKKKDYTLPSGKIVKIQGFEHIVLDELFSRGYLESDVIICDIAIENKIGKILYQFEGKTKRYFPDIYIVSENKIIEVKSDYTFNVAKAMNLAKQEACIKSGFTFSFEIR